jgi:hypothetical protein
MAVMVYYHRRIGVSSDSDNAPFDTGLAYHLAVMMCPSMPAQRTIWQ